MLRCRFVKGLFATIGARLMDLSEVGDDERIVRSKTVRRPD